MSAHRFNTRKACVAGALALIAALSAPAIAQPSGDLLAVAYEKKARGDEAGAIEAFIAAREAGIAPQRVALELAYVHLAHNETSAAREELEKAAAGPDQTLAAQARKQLDAIPGPWWADVYAESYGWRRMGGDARTTDLVPTVRVRGLLQLSEKPDIHAYLFGQATRDAASHGMGAGIPEIYADNHALAGGGAMLRLADRHIGLFAQAGPAIALIDDGKDFLQLDVRGGAFVAIASAACYVQGGSVEAGTWCAELYSEAVYTSRFDNNVQAFARERTGFSYLETGPVSWSMFFELRGALDRNGDYYNNFIDAGFGPRWRLRRPLPIDLLVGGHVGSYLGRENVDPAPERKDYVDFRVLVTTYVEMH